MSISDDGASAKITIAGGVTFVARAFGDGAALVNLPSKILATTACAQQATLDQTAIGPNVTSYTLPFNTKTQRIVVCSSRVTGMGDKGPIPSAVACVNAKVQASQVTPDPPRRLVGSVPIGGLAYT